MIHETLFRLLPSAVVLVDTGLLVIDASQACATLAGVSAADLVGSRLFDRLSVDEPSAGVPGDLRRAVEDGREASGEVTLAGRDGAGGRRLSVRVVPVEDGGQRFGLVVFSGPADGDDGESSRLQELGATIRSIKHEINNPLTGALGNINLLLRRDDLDEKARKRLTVAEQEMKKISQIVIRLAELVPLPKS